MGIHVKRVYAPVAPHDGVRVLVDRFWPRGVSKASLQLDEWAKELSPSSQLCKWFGHEETRWAEFQQRYFRELQQHPEPVDELIRKARGANVTLLYAARDEAHNNAMALKNYLETRAR